MRKAGESQRGSSTSGSRILTIRSTGPHAPLVSILLISSVRPFVRMTHGRQTAQTLRFTFQDAASNDLLPFGILNVVSRQRVHNSEHRIELRWHALCAQQTAGCA
jgi:hypothetical protein